MPRIAKNHPSSRLNLELSESARKTLESLRDSTQAGSLSEVVLRAIAIYDFLEIEKHKGNRLVIKDEHGTEREVVFL